MFFPSARLRAATLPAAAALIALALSIAACQPVRPLAAQPAAAQMAAQSAASGMERTAIEAQNLAVVERLYDEFNSGNPAVLADVHAATIRMHYAGEAEDVPAAELTADLTALKTANPDLQAVIHSNIAAGDYVFTELTWTTTHTGDYFGIPATGKTSLHPGIVVRRFQDGKIAESWEMFDDLAFLNSLGYLPDWDTIIAQGPMK